MALSVAKWHIRAATGQHPENLQQRRLESDRGCPEGEGEMMAENLWTVIYPWIVAGLGGFIGAALLLPTKLGEALFSYRLGKALEGFKADQSRELERLKEQLNHVGDRGRRSNEMEFSAIETVWREFVKAWLSTNTCIGSMTSIPNFSAMSEDEIKSFTASSGLNEREQKSLLGSFDKEKVSIRGRKGRLPNSAYAS
jgi:hypothetical protein